MKHLQRTLFLFLALCLALLPGAGAAEETLYAGIDVSVWQGEIDFQRVKDAGKELVYIRAGYGHFADRYFLKNAENARKTGLPIGFYFYVTATNPQQAQNQARFFAGLIRTQEYQCRPAVDFEQYGQLSYRDLNAIALAFTQTLEEETGQVPIFYTNASSARHIWDKALTRYPLWLAEYGVSHPITTGKWPSWAGWQYGTVRVDGIRGEADGDWFTAAVFLQPFLDVPYGAWYASALDTLYEKGIVRGTQERRFSPNRSTDRAEAVTFLYRLAGEPSVSGTLPFSDVPEGSWYYDPVRWAYSHALTQGVLPDCFAPKHHVTREDFALLLYRCRSTKGFDVSQRADLSAFQDRDQVSPWAQEAVSWAVAVGLLKGTTPETLAPQARLPRCQCVVILERFLALD